MNDTDATERTDRDERELPNYLPATPFSSGEPGRVERFLRKYLRHRGPLRGDRVERPPR
ncbi:hypothetical protein [Natronorarus salvus]|uniref:hypothetical protein n=1 Tax=Natronorarus salvus TaxID=3117733 RepID=UPI002F26CC1D